MVNPQENSSNPASPLRQLLSALPGAVLVTDSHGHVTHASEEGHLLLGQAREELLGKPLVDVLPVRPGEEKTQTVPVTSAIGEKLVIKARRGPAIDLGAGEGAHFWLLEDVTDAAFLSNAFMEAESREQRRLAQVLHDQLSQQLLGAAFSAKMLATQLDRQPPLPSPEEMHDLARMLNDCVGQLRDVTADPGIRAAAEGNLPAALHALAKLQHRAEVGVDFDDETTVDIGKNTPVVYRLVLDAVTYATAAGASRITIRCLSKPEFVAIDITSNEAVPSELTLETDDFAKKLYGFRCKAISANVSFAKNNDCGSTITLSIPVPL